MFPAAETTVNIEQFQSKIFILINKNIAISKLHIKTMISAITRHSMAKHQHLMATKTSKLCWWYFNELIRLVLRVPLHTMGQFLPKNSNHWELSRISILNLLRLLLYLIILNKRQLYTKVYKHSTNMKCEIRWHYCMRPWNWPKSLHFLKPRPLEIVFNSAEINKSNIKGMGGRMERWMEGWKNWRINLLPRVAPSNDLFVTILMPCGLLIKYIKTTVPRSIIHIHNSYWHKNQCHYMLDGYDSLTYLTFLMYKKANKQRKWSCNYCIDSFLGISCSCIE